MPRLGDMTALSLESPLLGVVGPKIGGLLERAIGVRTVGELLGHYPRRYAMRGELTPIASLPVGEQVTIVAEVRSATTRQMRARKGELLEVVISDGAGTVKLAFFSQPWRKAELKVGRQGIFSGKVGDFNGTKQFAHPDYELFDDEDEARLSATAKQNIPIPIYPATSTLPSWQIKKVVDQVLAVLGPVPDPLPEELRSRHSLLDTRAALVALHAPQRMEEVEPARETLRMHEAFLLQAALMQQREAVKALPATQRSAGDILARFDAALPFERTTDQVSVGERIATDLTGQWPMNRLVQGEVGSGKTLVALRAMLQVAQSGGQSALIAPTEVLAAQHLRSIARMLGPQLAPEVLPTLLTGQMPAAERRKAALRVASGQARVVVGTHALLSESTTFADLGLVVVDEQHRFGVEQRETLRAKGTSPHVLVLTATPIPRTVAMTVFGDLDVSTIRTLPAGRAGITTHVAPLAEKPGWFARVWERAAEEVASGRQVFVVCAAIDAEALTKDEQSERKKAEDAGATEADSPGKTRWGVVQVEQMLSRHPAFTDIRVAILHGKMPGEEKDGVMQSFARGEIDVLVATTVIEVGVDVPNASTMIILEAERFGVSQLHQLRGRVGRGQFPGLCLLVTEAHPASPSRSRIEAVASTTDGFALAEVDLELRGEGDVLGDAQSGARSSLRLLRVVADADLISEARAAAERVIAEDPALTRHPVLAAAIERRVGNEERAALAKN